MQNVDPLHAYMGICGMALMRHPELQPVHAGRTFFCAFIGPSAPFENRSLLTIGPIFPAKCSFEYVTKSCPKREMWPSTRPCRVGLNSSRDHEW